jgi:hypothetical protein
MLVHEGWENDRPVHGCVVHAEIRKEKIWALLNTGMNARFPNCYKPTMMSFVTSSEKLIHTLNQQRQNLDSL